jgi:hypothetical protein
LQLDNESEEERCVSKLDTGRPKSDTVAIPDLPHTNTGAVPCVQDSGEKAGNAWFGGKRFGLTLREVFNYRCSWHGGAAAKVEGREPKVEGQKGLRKLSRRLWKGAPVGKHWQAVAEQRFLVRKTSFSDGVCTSV